MHAPVKVSQTKARPEPSIKFQVHFRYEIQIEDFGRRVASHALRRVSRA